MPKRRYLRSRQQQAFKHSYLRWRSMTNPGRRHDWSGCRRNRLVHLQVRKIQDGLFDCGCHELRIVHHTFFGSGLQDAWALKENPYGKLWFQIRHAKPYLKPHFTYLLDLNQPNAYHILGDRWRCYRWRQRRKRFDIWQFGSFMAPMAAFFSSTSIVRSYLLGTRITKNQQRRQ